MKVAWSYSCQSSFLKLLFWSCVSCLVPEASSLHAAVIEVHAGQKAEGIYTAIEKAAPGDTIRVGPGHYLVRNMVIAKPLTLIGVDRPVLDGQLEVEIFTLAATHITIEGFKIVRSGRSSIEDMAGIKCLDAHYAVIRNNELDLTFFGIHLSNTDHAHIEGNVLRTEAEHEYQTGNGIHLWKCHHATIVNNSISGHRDGIYFEFVTLSSIRGNTSTGNKRYGLHFMFSHDDEYMDNTFKNNGAGVAVMYTRNVTMHRNVFEENWGSSSYGMLLKDIRDSEVKHNIFRENTSGIYMEGSSRILFSDNQFIRNGWAVKLQASCDDNVFTRNNFIGNTFDISTNGSLVLNSINSNYWDRYYGYDLERDGTGDIPFRPVSLFSVLVERIPAVIMLWRSFLVFLIDLSEKMVPVITPENLRDNSPQMKPYDHH